jgi:hypothetical protein
MRFQEAELVTPGTRLVYRGKPTEVLSVDRRVPAMIYFRLAGVGGRTSYARVMAAPPAAHRAQNAPRQPASPTRAATRIRRPVRARAVARSLRIAGLQAVIGITDLAITLLGLVLHRLDRCASWSRGLKRTERPHLSPRALTPRHSR